VLYGGGPDFEQRGDRIRLGLDVFGSVFFLVTRYEELVGDERDQHERYPARASVATREAFVERPLANELAEVLWACMRRLWPGVKRRRRQFALRLSHDVDFPLIAPVRAEAVERARRDLKVEKAPWVALRRLAARQFPRSTSPGRDLYNTFDALMRLSEGLGLQGAFYFIAGNTGGAIDGDYTLEDPWIQSLLRAIHDRGHEIGLHPSYGTFRDAEQTFREFDRLRRVCQALGIEQERWGGRQHYLRWENPTTWQNWENAGLDYDSTVGFAEQPGFRCGTCYEYPVFNLRTRQQLALRERPLIVMDASLFSYAGLTPRQAAEQVERLKARCRLFDGELTVLVHNDRFLSRRVRSAFRSVLA
jgi:peptidoglycan/xylan/chitin deacetylase (PgdA/CDA1 family)